MPTNYVPEPHWVVRYVAWGRLIKDEDDITVIGINPQAFTRRPSEETLSVTWADWHEQDSLIDNIHQAARTIRSSDVTVGAKSAFAYANCGAITAACQAYSKKIRIIHEPCADNEAHVGIHLWPDDTAALLARVAANEWATFVLNADVPV